MDTVKHQTLGIGRIVKRETCKDGKFTRVEEGGNYITVRFDNGQEIRFAIPKSFETGKLEVSAELQEEVDKAVAENERKRAEEKAKYGISDGIKPLTEVDTRVVKKPAKIVLTGDIRKDYETFLRASGYRENVVYQYPRSVDTVCNNENINYGTLINTISTIVKLYDKGGAKEKDGNYQHRTTINALKRFREFVKTNSPTHIVTP